MKLVLATVLGLAVMSTAALAGFIAPPAPLPLAGVAGPFGLVAAAAVYGVYRAAKYFRQ